jgi:succinyl-CoA synthetase beta subunit
MRLLEYQAKELLSQVGLSIPKAKRIAKLDSLIPFLPAVIKSQVPIGGRGKLGGVRVVESTTDFKKAVRDLFALNIQGYRPELLLAEEKISIAHEHYIALLIDRNSATIRLIAHKNGGVDIEQNNTPDFFNQEIDATIVALRAAQLATYLGYETATLRPFLKSLFAAFVKNDATLLEINPLIVTDENMLVCGDCKMELDDAARFRHPEWTHTEPTDTNFVTLNTAGTVATIANGAGLAMATVDAVAAHDMQPANFLDIGGGANTDSVLNAFRQIMEFPNIQAIVINIFAGITRCDEVAKAIIAAKNQISTLPPLFIRLAGTNFEEAVILLAAEDIATLATLEECLAAAKESTYA